MKLQTIFALVIMLVALPSCISNNTPSLKNDIFLYQLPNMTDSPYFTLEAGTHYLLDFQVYNWCFIRARRDEIYGFTLCSEIGVPQPDGPLSNLHVIIDAGHGGIDNGAHYFGIAEKDINFQIASILAEKLQVEGANVTMTIKDDETLNLYTRPSYANLIALLSLYIESDDPVLRNEIEPYLITLQEIITINSVVMPMLYMKEENTKAISDDLKNIMKWLENRNNVIFLSIHSNSTKDQTLNYRGTEIIYATNHLSLEYPGYEWYDEDTRIRLRDSLKVELKKSNILPWRKSFKGDYAVLRESNIPSLLLELGYLNNTDDNQILQMTLSQEQFADAIVKGIKSWHSDNTSRQVLLR